MNPEKILLLLIAQLLLETSSQLGHEIPGDNFDPYESEEELREVSELTNGDGLTPNLRIVYKDEVFIIRVEREDYQM